MKAIIVGTGFIAETHIEAIRRIGSEVSHVVGRDEARTEAFAKKHDIANWTCNLNDALDSSADIVHICTPPYAHAEQIKECLAAEKHIICEKPLCIDPKDAAELAELAGKVRSEKGIVAALCCNVRYYPANLEAAKRIRSEYKGGPLVMHGHYLQEFHLPPHPDGWRFDEKLSEGYRAISEIGTHWIDLAHAWTGQKISEVFADTRCWFPALYRKDGMLSLEEEGAPVKIATEDSAAILFRFEDGGMGSLLLSETAPGHPNDLSIEFTNLKTSYRWEESDPGKLYISANGTMQPHEFTVQDRESTFCSLFSEVYAAAKGKGTAIFPSFEDGLYISKVFAAIKESGQSQKWTRI